MEIFKHRNLALGCAVLLVSLAVSFYLNNLTRVIVLVASFLLAILPVIIYLITKKKGILDFIIKYTLLFVFIGLSMILSLVAFGKASIEKELYEKDNIDVVLTVEKIEYEKPYKTRFVGKIVEANGQNVDFSAVIEAENAELDKGDKISGTASIMPIQSSLIGYDERNAYLDRGIISSVVLENIEVLQNGNGNLSFIEKLNYNLSEIFKDNMGKEASALYSAVVLGNKSDLDDTVRRDAQRVGVSHALALSGMHITIIATLLGLVLRLFPIPRISKGILLICSVMFFVFLTGMSESAMRAGLMMSLFYFFKMMGKENDSITALFLAVSTICIVSPYMIFSVSLMLSFLALLGCFIASRFIRRIRLRRIRKKILRFILASFIATAFVMIFTLPIIAKSFGTVSIFTPISNLILVPIFTGVIYLGAFILVFSGIPGVSDGLFFLGEKLSSGLLYLIDTLASLDKILVPIYSKIQFVGIALIVISLILLMLSRKKHFKIVTGALCFSVIFFVFGCVFNYIDKGNNIYITSYNYKTSDFVAVEGGNELTLIDVSENTTGVTNHTLGFIKYVHASEVENYILTDYSGKASLYFKDVSSNVKINNLYLEKPNEDEIAIYDEIVKIAEKDKINVILLEDTVEFSKFTLDFLPKDHLHRSKKRSVSFNVSAGQTDLLYLGASSYEIFDYFTRDKAAKADVIIFGSHGPTYQKQYKYDVPNLEGAIFYGESRRYADWDLVKAVGEKEIDAADTPIRFKIKPKK